MKRIRVAVAAAAMVVGTPGYAQAAAADPGTTSPSEVFDEPLLTIDQAQARYPGRLSRVVLRFLSVMERTVNKDKQTLTEADWAPLGALLDQGRFHRVGNFAEHMGWPGYVKLLAGWAQRNWWKGYIWRMSEVPGGKGRPGLVYVEALERSSGSGPVGQGGKESALESISVYEIDASGKIVGLHVYDHRPR